MKKRGFSFLELMIAVIIIGVLAGIAVPNYFRVVERTRGAEARNTLAIIYRGFKTLSAENIPLPLTVDLPPVAAWSVIMMDNPNESTRAWFSYWVYDGDNGNNGGEVQCSTALLANTAYARRRTGNPPFTAYTAPFDNTRCLAIDLNTGNIVSSPEY
ncbi:MAG: prepilin-type N-terminal cleavage/methylation domain-containing protein [Candidatus Omnitrophota bacterium]